MNLETWLDFIEWEQNHKNFKSANSLYWRAIKALEEPENFIQEHNKMTNSSL